MTTVLVAVADTAVATMLERVLVLDGHAVEVVADGAAAAVRLAGDPVDVLVLEAGIGGTDRAEQDRLRSLPGRTVVVVPDATSAPSAPADLWAHRGAGADYVLTAPFDLGHLRAVVRRLAAGDAGT